MYFLFPLFGLLIGSFANVVILRLHSEKKGILTGHSECPHCHHRLGFWDLIPVFSWLFLRGRCRYCHNKISVQYPLVELSMAFLWLLIALLIPISGNSSGSEWGHLFLALFIFSGLFTLTIYDLKYLELPDQISFLLIIVLFLTLPFSFPTRETAALLSALGAGGFFLLQFLLSHGKWVGAGDIRLGVILGLFLGWPKSVAALVLAYMLGGIAGIFLLVLQRKKLHSVLPFGPFLALGIFIAYFWGNALLTWYLQTTGLQGLLS